MDMEIPSNLPRAKLLELLRSLPAMLSGRSADKYGFVYRLLRGLGFDVLVENKLDFVVKSRGGTDRAGIRWPPLSPATLARRRQGTTMREKHSYLERRLAGFRGSEVEKRRLMRQLLALARQHSGGTEILRDTGVLFNSLSPEIEGRQTTHGQIFEVRPGRVRLGTNVPYARYHQFGTRRMPRRKFLWDARDVPQVVRLRVMRMLRDRLVKVIFGLVQ